MATFKSFLDLTNDEQANALASGFDVWDTSFENQYRVARMVGEARFGSECRHEHTAGGYCRNCLRRVVTK